MKVLIHACPKRMWYVDGFLYPSLREQGLHAGDIDIWNDSEKKGNLISCMDSFASRPGDGDTWHIQDDVILCHDFVDRCRRIDETFRGVAFGFCCEHFTDDIRQLGKVHQPDSWHSFQCVRIPDAYARECADWFYTDASFRFIFSKWVEIGQFDDSFFRSFMEDRHGGDIVLNVAPNLVDHIDYLIGGSILSEYRGHVARSDIWTDDELVENLRAQLRERT